MRILHGSHCARRLRSGHKNPLTLPHLPTASFFRLPSHDGENLASKSMTVRCRIPSGRSEAAARLASVRLLHLAHLHRTRVVLAVGSIATESFALGNAVAGDPRRAATNMHGNVITLFMTTLLRLHIVRSDYRCSGISGEHLRSSTTALASSSGGSDAVKIDSTLSHARVWRIWGRFGRR